MTFCRLIQGDCRQVLTSLQKNSVNLAIVDPPYSSGAVHKTIGGRYNQERNALLKYDDLSERGLRKFIEPVFQELWRIATVNSHIYCWTDWKQMRNIMDWIELASFRLNGILVWNKIHFGTGRPWRSQVEFIIYASKGKPRVGNRLNHPNIFHEKRGPLYSKPQQIIQTIIDVVTDIGDVVIAPFLGREATTLKSCQHLGRSCIGIEINPEYCELIKQTYFGEKVLDHNTEYRFEVFQ